jgi:hypothetical protein
VFFVFSLIFKKFFLTGDLYYDNNVVEIIIKFKSMAEVKTSQDVGYTKNGEPGKQCRDCANYEAVDDNSGNCFGHQVLATGNCQSFKAK